MANTTVSALRLRLATQIGTIPGWRESRWPYDVMPAEPGAYAHLAYAVGVLSTEFDAPLESSITRRGALGGAVTTAFGIRWTASIKADGAVAAYDAALDHEAALLKCVLDVAYTDMHVFISGMTRRAAGDGAWLLCEMTGTLRHRIALL